MTQRQVRLILMFLGVCFAFAPPAQAQRSGFIIGVGLGPGYSSYSAPGALDRVSKAGLAIDFHIGGVIGDSFELFFVEKLNAFGSDVTTIDLTGSGFAGIGFAYPLNPDFSITGGLGLGVWIQSTTIGTVTVTNTEMEGIGLMGGGRYQLSESGRWMLNFDIMYGEARDITDWNAWGLQATINVVSH